MLKELHYFNYIVIKQLLIILFVNFLKVGTPNAIQLLED